MTWLLLNTVGALLVVVALHDIFRTLWHPGGLGWLTRVVCRALWGAAKVLGRRGRPGELAGPLGLLLTVLVWAGLVTVGFALVYLPHLPDGFNLDASVDQARTGGLVDALYVSLTMLGTLGLGDIAPELSGLRVVLPLQALVGFILLTAAISWILQTYPSLGRRRALACRLDALDRASTGELVRTGEPGSVTHLLHELSASLGQVGEDLLLYTETYFFRESRPSRSLPAQLPVILDLVAAGEASPHREVRHAAAVLRIVAGDLAQTLSELYLGEQGGTEQALRAFAADHQHAWR